MNSQTSRRDFLKSTAAIGVGAWIVGQMARLAERARTKPLTSPASA